MPRPRPNHLSFYILLTTGGINLTNHTHTRRLAALGLVATLLISSLVMLAPPAAAETASVSIPPIERRPIITISADDGHASVYNYAYPILSQYDIVQTFFVPSDYVGKENYVSLEQLLELQAAGWEIGSHGVNHTSLTGLTAADATEQMVLSKERLIAMGLNVETIAYPFGNTSNDISNIAKEHYLAARSVSSVYSHVAIEPERVSLSGDDYNGRRMGMQLAELAALIDQAISEGKWLHIFYHTVDTNGNLEEGVEGVSLDSIASYLAAKRDAGLCDVLTFRDAYYRCMAMNTDLTPAIAINEGYDELINLRRNVLEDMTITFEGVTLDNIVRNPSLESFGSGLFTDYTKNGGLTWTTSSDAMDGSQSAKLTADPLQSVPNRGMMSYRVVLAEHGITAGDRVWFGLNVKNISDVQEINVGISWFDAANASVAGGLASTESISSSWERYPSNEHLNSRGAVVPAGAVKARLYLEIKTITDGAENGVCLTDGWWIAKVPYDTAARPYAGARPMCDYVGTDTKTTDPSVTINGQRYSFEGELATGQTATMSIPYSGILRMTDITAGGSGVFRVDIGGTRVLDSIGPEIISVNGTAPDITVTTAPYVGDGKAICYWGDRITMVSESSVKHYTGSGGMCVVDLAGGMEQRIVSTTTYQIDNAMSPLYAVIPVVFVLAVLGGLFTMLGRVKF